MGNGDLSYLYFTCKHCGGVRRQVMREVNHGPGYINGWSVLSVDVVVPPRKPCYHRNWDDGGWNFVNLPSDDMFQAAREPSDA